jgi:glycosyltransferase involved in cell wall biosynthesis
MERTLIITPFFRPNIGGAETFAEDLAKALAKKYIVHVSTIKWDKPVIWEGLKIKPAMKMFYKLVGPVLRMTTKYKYEKIFALGLIPSLLCALFNIKFNSIILALYDFKERNFIVSFVLNKADKVFVEGKEGEQDMLNAGVQKEKIVRFQHWCDQTRFSYVERNNEVLKVVFVGRPIKIKGRHIIEECEKLTKGISYEYVDNVSYQDLPKYYQGADVCVVPSLYSEGFSRVVIESASCGCVLITSNKGALPEMVKDFGDVIEPTPQNFKERLEKLKNLKLLEERQLQTTLYAKTHFGEKNADCFLL